MSLFLEVTSGFAFARRWGAAAAVFAPFPIIIKG
jgi:hypothetical protein